MCRVGVADAGGLSNGTALNCLVQPEAAGRSSSSSSSSSKDHLAAELITTKQNAL
jgi:hypothetical protein